MVSNTFIVPIDAHWYKS